MLVSSINSDSRDPGKCAAGRTAHRKLYIHPEVFARLQTVQRQQEGSPRFDLADLASAALNLMLSAPNAAKVIERRARVEFVERQSGEGCE